MSSGSSPMPRGLAGPEPYPCHEAPHDRHGSDGVSLEGIDLPVDDGIRQLLRDYDSFPFDAPGDDRFSSLRVVWLYRKGAGSALQPVPRESSNVAELREQVASPNARVREHAYIALLARPDDPSRELVWSALRGATEIDEDLRQQILVSAMNRRMEVPQDLLANLVLGNDSATLRVLALDALAENPAIESVAASVANDPSPMVRQRAQEILQAKAAQIGSSTHSRSAPQPHRNRRDRRTGRSADNPSGHAALRRRHEGQVLNGPDPPAGTAAARFPTKLLQSRFR